jgi:hypothetical protein
LDAVFLQKYGPLAVAGPNVRVWHRLGFRTPDEFYEAFVAKLLSRILHHLELAAWAFFSRLALIYPENCILAAYKRQ